VLSASVVVPRGYFAQIYRRSAANAVEPTDALLQPIIDTNVLKIRHLVRSSLGLKNDSDVTVEVYEDSSSASVPATQMAAPIREQAVVLPQLSTLWNQWTHKTQWTLAGVGVMTLLMVSTMLRRGSGAMAAPQPVDPSSVASMRTPASRSPMAAASRINFGDEDEDHEDADLLRQVRELATARPEDAARVLRQWIYQG
jgi:flagellar biosynthesis/type III secretory pathway M-ring protein FliF/YscJ